MSVSTLPSDDRASGVSPPTVAELADAADANASWRALVRCPACRAAVDFLPEAVACRSPECRRRYPLRGDVPVMVDEDRSVFSVDAFLAGEATFFKPVSRWRQRASRLLPTLDLNLAASANFARLRDELKRRFDRSRVLVIGGGILGAGMERLLDDPRIELVETDASVGPRTQLICDAHDLPFADAGFEGVVVQAVLEHVLDPWRVAREIHRVLAAGGLVYSDVPFIAQVHGREFDFHRFTRLGHRRLFRHFAELDSGITAGPAVATAWTLRYLALSCFQSRWARAIASAAARATLFPLKYLDYWLVGKRGASDAAAAFYFLGEKAEQPLDDRRLIAGYRGGF